MFFGRLMEFAVAFFDVVADLTDWFFTPIDLAKIVSRFTSPIFKFLIEKFDLLTGIEMAPSEFFIWIGFGTLLGLVIVKFFVDFIT